MASNGPKSVVNMAARVFVANVPSDKIDVPQMKGRFEKYGKVLDVFISKTFAFIQFEADSEAAAAIAGESGTFIEENKIECSLAKRQPKRMRPAEQTDGAPPRGPVPYAQQSVRGRERSPLRYDPRQAYRYAPPDPYYNEGYHPGAGELGMPGYEPMLASEDPPPRPRTPEYLRDLERRQLVQRRQLEDNTAYHLERMQNLKAEHKLRIEIMELEKQHVELKMHSLQQQSGPPPRQEQPPPLSSALRPYSYSPLTSAGSTYKTPASLQMTSSPRGPPGLRSSSLMNQPPPSLMGNPGMY